MQASFGISSCDKLCNIIIMYAPCSKKKLYVSCDVTATKYVSSLMKKHKNIHLVCCIVASVSFLLLFCVELYWFVRS